MGRPRVYNRNRKIIGATISPAAYANYLKLPAGERSQRISRWLERIDPEADAREPGDRGERFEASEPKPKVVKPKAKQDFATELESAVEHIRETSVNDEPGIYTLRTRPTKAEWDAMGPTERAMLESEGIKEPIE